MGMHHAGLNKEFTFDKVRLLEILRTNRDEHMQIVKEAKEGWQKATLDELADVMKELTDDSTPRTIHFSAGPVDDHTDVYDTFIMQLDMAQETTLELDGDQFRKLVQDKWDWQANFLHSNAMYSETAVRKLR